MALTQSEKREIESLIRKEIKEFITHIIDNGQTDMIKCFMKLVFEKAASEEMFCPLYARLLSELR